MGSWKFIFPITTPAPLLRNEGRNPLPPPGGGGSKNFFGGGGSKCRSIQNIKRRFFNSPLFQLEIYYLNIKHGINFIMHVGDAFILENPHHFDNRVHLADVR